MEHSVANMLYISLAYYYGGSVTVGEFLDRSLIPSILGNIIGGALGVAIISVLLFTDATVDNIGWRALYAADGRATRRTE
jgi:formate/nitrite transporter FocA (FNT family)